MTGWVWPPEDATASSAFVAARASSSLATKSRGRNGQSPAALSIHFASGRFAAIQSSPARMPASGPGKSATLSEITGKWKAAKRAGSPLALRINPSHCGSRRAITRCRMVLPAMVRIGLSPPPIRRASPPAKMTPGSLVIVACTLASVPRRFLFDIFQTLIIDDALFARERKEAFATRASDQSQPDLPRQIDSPGGEAGTRDENRNTHAHGLDHHFGSEPPGGVQNFVGGIDAVAVNPAGDLVGGVMTANVLRVTDRRPLLAEHAAMDRTGFQIKRRHRVDGLRHLVEPGS